MEITAAALRTIDRWAEEGEDFLPVELRCDRPAYVGTWAPGDIVATQGDAHVHVVDAGGQVKEDVPPALILATGGPE
jgi:hypothetical protein